MDMPRVKTIFLDRDGVINRSPAVGKYVTSWHEFEFLPGAVEAIRLLNESGFLVIVVTNQRGVALKEMHEEMLNNIHNRMVEEVLKSGARVDAIYYCPHHEDSCACRKPKTGLFMRAKADFPSVVFEDAFVIGDSSRDLEAGRKLGARVIRIGPPGAGEPSAPSLMEAVTRYVLPSALPRNREG